MIATATISDMVIVAYVPPKSTVAGSVGGLGAQAAKWAHHFGRLYEMRKFQADWDGEGALAPDPLVVDHAIRILKNRQQDGGLAPDWVALTSEGTVAAEWRDGPKRIVLEVDTTDTADWIVDIDGRAPLWTKVLSRRGIADSKDFFLNHLRY